MEDIRLKQILSGKVSMVPMGEENTYYVGSTYSRRDQSRNTTEEMYEQLNNGIRQLTPLPYEVIEHRAGVRPTIKDRKPIIGVHPNFNSVCIFNGMGAKGYSLSPYFANHFVQHLILGTPLLKEVDITRNLSLYET